MSKYEAPRQSERGGGWIYDMQDMQDMQDMHIAFKASFSFFGFQVPECCASLINRPFLKID